MVRIKTMSHVLFYAMFFFMILTFIIPILAADQKSTCLKASDCFDLEFTQDCQISPDGKKVVYVRHFMDIMTDRRYYNLWVVNFDGTGHRPLTTGKYVDVSPRWSSDSSLIIYISNRSGSFQIHKRWMDTGQSVQLTNLQFPPSGISWSPDGKHIAFSSFIPAEREPLVMLPSPPPGAKWAEPARVIDKMFYRLDGEGYLEPGFTHLFIVPSEGGTPRQITRGNFNHGDQFSWTPDGKYLLFSANIKEDSKLRPADSEVSENTEVYEVSIETGNVVALTDRKGPDNSPVISPDGKYISYTGFDDRYQGYQITMLYVMNRDGSNSHVLSSNLNRSVLRPRWAKDSRGIYFMYDDFGDKKLGFYTLEGRLKKLIGNIGNGRKAYEVGGNYSVSRNDRYAITFTRSDVPSDIAVGSKKDPKAKIITAINQDLLSKRVLGKVEEIWYHSSQDQRKIHGWIIKPPAFDPSKKYPLILEIHGGPYANYGDRFDFEKQVWAAHDYVILYTNPRGSTSYGEEFGNLTHHAYPGDDYYDLNSGINAVIEKGYIDPENLFVTGGSGGGVLTCWMIGQTVRFRAAATLFPVINWYSFNLTSDIAFYLNRYWFPGFPWDHQEHYMKRSPISLVGNVKTPTLVLCGEEDFRAPISESEQYYQALRLLNVESVLIRVPGEPHGARKRPSHYMARILYVISWFEKYRKIE